MRGDPCVAEDIGVKAKEFLENLDAAHAFRSSVEFILQWKALPTPAAKVSWLVDDLGRFDRLEEWIPKSEMLTLRSRLRFIVSCGLLCKSLSTRIYPPAFRAKIGRQLVSHIRQDFDGTPSTFIQMRHEFDTSKST